MKRRVKENEAAKKAAREGGGEFAPLCCSHGARSGFSMGCNHWFYSFSMVLSDRVLQFYDGFDKPFYMSPMGLSNIFSPECFNDRFMCPRWVRATV